MNGKISCLRAFHFTLSPPVSSFPMMMIPTPCAESPGTCKLS